MGLAPYGYALSMSRPNPLQSLIDLKDDGSFRLNTRFFGYLDSPSMSNAEFHELFGGPPRQPESRITRRRNGPRGFDLGGHRRRNHKNCAPPS